MYIRCSISAQSQASVPPAPALISRKVSLPSASPSRSASSSFSAATATSFASAASASATTSASSSISPSSIISTLSDSSRSNASIPSMESFRPCRSRISFCARSGLSHSVGSSIIASNSSRRCAAVSQSRRRLSRAMDLAVDSTLFWTSARTGSGLRGVFRA